VWQQTRGSWARRTRTARVEQLEKSGMSENSQKRKPWYTVKGRWTRGEAAVDTRGTNIGTTKEQFLAMLQ
jgi:hypothetical protein